MKQSPLKLLLNCLVNVIIVTMAFTINACSKRDDVLPIVDPRKGNIRFAIQIESSEKESSFLLGSSLRNIGHGAIAVSPPVSRTDFTTAFVQGDSIGIFAVAAGQPLSASGNLLHNIKLVYDGTSWETDAKWIPEVASYDFYAYYPFDSGMIDPTNYRFEVRQDQRDFSTFSSSDLMSAKQTSVGLESVVNLTFQHLLSLIQVEVPASASDGSIPNENLEIMLNRLQYAGSFNLFSQQFSIGGAFYAGIRPYRVEKPDAWNYKTTFTYRALVPAQTIPANHPLIFITQGSATQVTKQTTTLQMAPSSAYRFTFDVPFQVSAVFIEANKFLMGNPDPLVPASKMPLHWLKLTKDFYKGKSAVTIQKYGDFLNANTIKNQTSPAINNAILLTKSGNSTPSYDTGLNKWIAVSGYENYPMSLLIQGKHRV